MPASYQQPLATSVRPDPVVDERFEMSTTLGTARFGGARGERSRSHGHAQELLSVERWSRIWRELA